MNRSTLFLSAICLTWFGGHASVASALVVDEQATAVATNLGLYGIEPQDIVVDPTDGNYVYAASYTPNGIFHSSDGGVTWAGFPAGSNYGAGKAVEVDATTGDVYALIADSLLKSTDHAATWTDIADNFEEDVLEDTLLVANGSILVALHDGLIAVSTDDGALFTEAAVDEGKSKRIISLAAGAAQTFYAVVQDEQSQSEALWKSIDGGSTWTDLSITAHGVTTGDRVYDITVDPADANHLVLASYDPDSSSYHSLNGGDTWTALTSGDYRIGASESEFDGNGRLYIGRYYSDNSSVAVPTWSLITTSTPLSDVAADVYAVDPSNPNVIFTSSNLGIAKSEDSAQSWSDVIEGLTALQTYAIAQSSDKDTVWIGATGGLARTRNFTDDEPTWTYPIFPADGLSDLKAVWVHPADDDIVVVGASTFLTKSSDGGETWTQSEGPEFFGSVQQIVQSPRAEDTLYAIFWRTSTSGQDDTGGVLKSTDAGSTWEDLKLPNDLPVGALAVGVRDDHDIVYVGVSANVDTKGVYTFTDSDWQKLDENFKGFMINSIFVQPDDNNVMFVTARATSTEGSLYRSDDGGATWELITTGLEQANHLDSIVSQSSNSSNWYMSGQDGATGDGVIYKSTDAGASWSISYRGLKQEFFYTLLFDGLIVGNDQGLYSVQSLGALTLKVKHKRAHVTLRDGATKKVLANRTVFMYQKKQSRWQRVATLHTDASGTAAQRLTAAQLKKGTRLKVVWKPAKQDRAEYAHTESNSVQVR